MRPFRYARPTTVDELLGLLQTHGSAARLLAGGTDLLVRLRLGHLLADTIVDIKRVEGLRADIVHVGAGPRSGGPNRAGPNRAEPNGAPPAGTPSVSPADHADHDSATSRGGALRIGARALMGDIADDQRVQRWFPALVEAARVVGSVQIRNRATLAGNICNASPAADTAPALLVYQALVNIVGRAGSRRVPVDEFFTGPGRTVLQPTEIVESIDLPLPAPATGAAFGRVTRRFGVDLATLNLCCLVTPSGETRFAYGAVGPRPFLVRDESGLLADRDTPIAARDELLQRLMQRASPISDVRADRDYRLAMLDVMSRRALATAIARRARAASQSIDDAPLDGRSADAGPVDGGPPPEGAPSA